MTNQLAPIPSGPRKRHRLSRRTAGVAKSIASSKERNLTVENLSVDVVAIYFSISNELFTWGDIAAINNSNIGSSRRI